MTEADLLNKIAELDIELINAKLVHVNAKRTAMHAETIFIECKIAKERAVEELRVYRNTTVDYEPTHQEKDIARFKAALPNLLKNDKWVEFKKNGDSK